MPAIEVALEVGRSRTFASAVDWPGWCRSGRGADAALHALAEYAPRYARVVGRAGLRPPAPELSVVETVTGTRTTDFGAPDVAVAADLRPVDAAEAARLASLLAAAWAELDAVAAGAPAELRKGPRGGGRDRDGVVAHVAGAERAYARKLGIGLGAVEWREGGIALLRARVSEAVGRPSGGGPLRERGWPVRYLVRRAAWHVLDHAWEIEDRSAPAP